MIIPIEFVTSLNSFLSILHYIWCKSGNIVWGHLLANRVFRAFLGNCASFWADGERDDIIQRYRGRERQLVCVCGVGGACYWSESML